MSSEISSDGLKSPSCVFAPFESAAGFDGAGFAGSATGFVVSGFDAESATGGGSLTGALGGAGSAAFADT
jgi:hypothetical protein